MTQTDDNKIFSMIALATKAGKTRAGAYAVKQAVRQKKAKLVVIANDVSDNTKKSFINSCTYYQVDYTFFSDMQMMGKCIGKEFCAVIAIMDTSFANMLNGGVKSC